MAFIIEPEAREAIAAVDAAAPALGGLVVRYLGLFRPPQRALALKRAVRIVTEIAEAAAAGKLRRHGRDWPVTAGQIREAIQATLDARDARTLTLPLKDNAYLFEIACRLANKTEAVAEAKVELDRRVGANRGKGGFQERRTSPETARSFLGGLKERLTGGSNDD